ncbi:undecaprenyl-phosphate glucose phosphotransferase [Pontibacter mangrovi]|uniref:Undecaprenyl-phosphate glucose phosphotransferase n=1 Tax=Pontibacter mangrovi TaxID=2589816 RepID=A0A501WBE7_9BACT|nr:undecaprenyl-phosphate glucose phosphotransferase [Pontibacter mangrovi]TPE46132.1 undecaprenyl-phosphate glucose phosphotransferase [Pontibacter mangrovi]
MPGLYSKYIKLVHSVGDIAAVALSSAGAHYMVFGEIDNLFTQDYLLLFLYSILGWIICASLLELYKVYRISKISTAIVNVLKVSFLFIVLTEAALNITGVEDVSRMFLLYRYILLIIMVILWRTFIIIFLRKARKSGYNYRNIIVVGVGEAGIELSKFFKKHPEHGYRFLGFFDDTKRVLPEKVGKISEVEKFVLQNNVDEIYCCPFELEKEQVQSLLSFVDNNMVRLKFLPEPGELPIFKLKVDLHDFMPVLILRPIPLDDITNKALKRAFDLLFSSIVILFILSWLLPLLAIVIRLDSKGPILFKQARSGIDNKAFSCWKLRSMYVNSDANFKQARRGDSRITPVGAFLRKTSLDELPQFFNVFMGQMSIVGPRPHMLKHTQEYSPVVDKYMVRHFIKPGITGLSQVRGYRGDTTHSYQIRGRVKLDIFYLENWSFWLDLKIIFYTVYNVIRGDKAAF